MKVEIIKAFSAGPHGNTHYAVGQIAQNGEQSWIDKGLAVAVKDAKPGKKSAG